MQKPPRNTFHEALTASLQAAASAAGQHTWQAQEEPSTESETAIPGAPELRAALSFSGGLTGELVLSVSSGEAAPLLGNADAAEETWRTLMQSVGEQLCTRLSSGGNRSTLTECRAVAAEANAGRLLSPVVLRSHDEYTAMHITVAADENLMTHLSSKEQSIAEPLPPQTAPLHRVIDVPLSVTLRFGERHLSLREVLALNTGSLVELDRHVEDPVDLMLGERLIARGEVVIVDGNYGMRVTEVIEAYEKTALRANLSPLRYATPLALSKHLPRVNFPGQHLDASQLPMPLRRCVDHAKPPSR